MAAIYNDWTGSSKQRREQGVCLPPSIEPNSGPRYQIPLGTRVLVRPVAGIFRWTEYTTKQPLSFRRHEQRKMGKYTFRHEGWLIRVAIQRVKDSASLG